MRQQQTNEQATKASARRRLIRTVGTKSDLTMRRRRIEEQALHRRSTGDASNRETRLHRRVPHHRADTRRRPCVDLTLAHARQHATDENGRPARHSRPHSTPRRSANAGFRPCLPTPRQSTTHARPATCRGEPARKPRAAAHTDAEEKAHRRRKREREPPCAGYRAIFCIIFKHPQHVPQRELWHSNGHSITEEFKRVRLAGAGLLAVEAAALS